MRLNAFGEVYCFNAFEVLATLADENCEADNVYLCEIMAPEAGEVLWCGEIADDVTGDLICYIEASSLEEVRAIAAQAGIDDQS